MRLLFNSWFNWLYRSRRIIVFPNQLISGLLILLIVVSSGCTVANNVVDGLTATIPADVDPQAIQQIDHATISALAYDLAREHPGLISVTLYGTYEEQFRGLKETYHIDEGQSFLGQINIFNGDSQPHQIAVICLLNHVQTPCTPASHLFEQYEIDPMTEFQPPVELPPLTVGRHDFDALVVRDPFDDITESDLDSRSETVSLAATRNLYVGNLASPPDEIDTVYPPPNPGLQGYSSLFWVGELPGLIKPNGLIPVWLSSTVSPDEMVDFYIHLNGLDQPEGKIITVTAFINYEQVPLYFEGKPYTPLFVEREARTWQPARVQVRAPHEPGIYELLIYGRAHAFEPIEIGRLVPLVIFSDVSQRIRLEVR